MGRVWYRGCIWFLQLPPPPKVSLDKFENDCSPSLSPKGPPFVHEIHSCIFCPCAGEARLIQCSSWSPWPAVQGSSNFYLIYSWISWTRVRQQFTMVPKLQGSQVTLLRSLTMLEMRHRRPLSPPGGCETSLQQVSSNKTSQNPLLSPNVHPLNTFMFLEWGRGSRIMKLVLDYFLCEFCIQPSLWYLMAIIAWCLSRNI